jgi:hypothetical protein
MSIKAIMIAGKLDYAVFATVVDEEFHLRISPLQLAE